MNLQLSDAYFHTPGVKRFLQALLNDLIQGRNLLLLLPYGLDPVRIWEKLRAGIWNQDYEFREISLVELSSSLSPVVAIAEILNVKWPTIETPRTVSNLFKCAGLPEIILLEGLHELNDTSRIRWIELIIQWAQVAQNENSNNRVSPVL